MDSVLASFENFLLETTSITSTLVLSYVTRGPTGKGVDLCDIQLGDVIFMYEYYGPNPGWKHTVIVDKIDGDTCNGNNVLLLHMPDGII